jgi:hypothetical protein
MTLYMETKVMTQSGARRIMMFSLAALVMTNSVVMQMKTIVRTMRVSPYPA